jgi:formylglycine-generating enzyme required for sulfatase activity
MKLRYASITGAYVTAALLWGCGSGLPGPHDFLTYMVHIAGGTFQMGSGGIGFPDEQPVHTVTVYGFYMDRSEVTQADYESRMNTNPSYFTGDSLRPVESVTWFDAVLYCNARSRQESKDTVYTYTSVIGTPGNGCSGLEGFDADFSKNGFRLPTEAEWEYACRAGEAADYYWGDSHPPAAADDTAAIDAQAVWNHNSNGSTARAGSKESNGLGLYDMAGNVWEWCGDWYGSYPAGSQTNPSGPSGGSSRVCRGGSCFNASLSLRSATRLGDYYPGTRISNLGFRCVRQ